MSNPPNPILDDSFLRKFFHDYGCFICAKNLCSHKNDMVRCVKCDRASCASHENGTHLIGEDVFCYSCEPNDVCSHCQKKTPINLFQCVSCGHFICSPEDPSLDTSKSKCGIYNIHDPSIGICNRWIKKCHTCIAKSMLYI
jgi:hypothetical protein